MKFSAALILATLLGYVAAHRDSPAKKVIDFIKELKAEIQADTDDEAASFGKFKDWCNATVTAATSNIDEEKSLIEDCNQKIESWSGAEAASGAEVLNAKKNLKENAKSQAASRAAYDEEHKEYLNVTGEMNASILAMKNALAELGGAKAPVEDGAFLQNKASAKKAVRRLLFQPMLMKKLSEEDMEVLRSFAAVRSSKQQFLQVRGINEGYDKSGGQAVGVIETTLEDFQADKSKADNEHADLTNAYNAKMTALADEASELTKYINDQATLNGQSATDLADTKTLRHETAAELKADEKLLESTQDTCKEKTYQFEQRSKLRAQEMTGIDQALSILTNGSANETFKEAAKVSFAQVGKKAAKRTEAYEVLQAVASKYHDLKLAQLAVTVKAAGHFDTVMRAIDRQVVYLQAEEKQDVDHRDRCQKQLANAAAGLASLDDLLTKTSTKIQRLENQEQEMETALLELQGEINQTKEDIANRSAERAEERAEYLTALEHDEEALELISSAMVQIQKFYKENGIDVVSMARAAPDPDGVDEVLNPIDEVSMAREAPDPVDKKAYESAPDAGFEDQNYEGGKDSTNTLLEMMSMVKKDMGDEIANGKAQEEENLALFEKDYTAMQELLKAQKEKEVSSTKALADLESDIEVKKEFKDDKVAENASSQVESTKLSSDCAWIKDTFASRREKRKAEIDGLVQAKGLLAGVAP